MVFFIPFIIRDNIFKLKVTNMKGIIIRGLAGFLAMLLFFHSLRQMSSANALLLVNTSPIFVPIILYMAYSIRTSSIVVFGVLISFIGVGIVLMPSLSTFDIFGVLGILAGFFGAVATVLLRTIGKYNTPNQMMFYYFLFGIIFSIIAMAIEWKSISFNEISILALVGILGLLFQFSLTYSLYLTKVRIVAPIMLTSILFGAVMDWINRSYIPHISLLIGSIVVLVGIVLVIYFLND